MLVNSITFFFVLRALFGKPRKWVPIWYRPREQWRIKRLWDISGATREIRNTVVVGRLIRLVVVTNAVVRVNLLTLFRPEGFFSSPFPDFSSQMSKNFNKFKTVQALHGTARVDQLFQLLSLIRILYTTKSSMDYFVC